MPAVGFDTAVPALVVKAGRYPVHAGGLAAARSLGRVGVPVAAMVDDVATPLAQSRYVKRRLPPLDPRAGAGAAVTALRAAALAVGGRPIALATDDEAGVLLAELADDLVDVLRLPTCPPELPRELASKAGLARACERAGVDTPLTWLPASPQDVETVATQARFPIVLKNRDPFLRHTAAAVAATTVLDSPSAWRDWARERLDPRRPLLVQEYVPPEAATMWFVHAYRASGSDEVLAFTARKHRDFPVGSGPTTFAEWREEPGLRSRLVAALRSWGYRGACDVDVVHDARDDRWLVIDVNPRLGANLAGAVTTAGIDLPRAAHLDLTGRPWPEGEQVAPVFFRQELHDPAAVRGGAPEVAVPRGAPLVGAFAAPDDRRPALVAAARHRVGRARQRLGR